MGRVARYKKVKKDPRERAPTALPEAPQANADKHVPRGLRMIMKFKSGKQIGKKKKGSRGGGGEQFAHDVYDPSAPKDAPNAKKKGKGKGKGNGNGDGTGNGGQGGNDDGSNGNAGEGGGSRNSNDNKAFSGLKIRKKESLKQFSRRVDKEAADTLRLQVTRETNKSAKRKEWAAKKKEKKREEREDRADRIAGATAEDDSQLFEQDQPDFGEVAMAPPQLALKLRRPESALHRTPLLLSDQLGRDAKQRRKIAPIRAQTLEAERTRAIDAYRAFKANKAAVAAAGGSNGSSDRGNRGNGSKGSGTYDAGGFSVGDDDDNDF